MIDKTQKENRKDEMQIFKHVERINSRSIYERTKRIGPKKYSARDVFEHNLFQWWFCRAHWTFTGNSLKTIYNEIQYLYKEGLLYEEELTGLCISNFLSDEIKYIEIEERIPGKRLPDSIKQYLQFLENNRHRYEVIDELILQTQFQEEYPSLKSFVKGKINEGDMDIGKLDKEQKNLLWWCDRILLNELIHFKRKEMEEVKKDLEYRFDFDYYKNPVLFAEFPKEKNKYLKALKSWLLAQMDKRINILGLKSIPEIYQFIITYANSLVPTGANLGKGNKGMDDNPKEPDFVQQDYPKYIFRDYKAFQLFISLANNCKTRSQISFFYRQMAEKEDPPLIVVRDTLFREWFNTWSPGLILNEHTKTYLNSKNRDRIAMYFNVKDLIFNNS